MLENKQNTISPIEVGIFDLGMKPIGTLGPGEVGYIVTGSKNLSEFTVGETIIDLKGNTENIIEGFSIMFYIY